jgi:hypothetical protein
MGRNADTASYLRGFQIIRPILSRKDVLNRHGIGGHKTRQYATFIAQDWKHGVECECPCDPQKLGNYFVKSDLPYETSPVFFRPEVLQKYKADTDKYQLRDRTITCRHAWQLETYDVNEVGQVHTYLVYLSRLPYDEQLYWKSFNESPRGPISKRALQSDFEGKWPSEYDPLQSLRRALAELHEKKTSWWKLRENNLLGNVHYPVTKAADEWAKELHALDKLIIEGFVMEGLRERLIRLGGTLDARWGSLALLERILVAGGMDGGQGRETLAPLRELHSFRSKISGHAAGKEAQQIKAKVLKTYKTYASHFRDLCTRCDKTIRLLRDVFEPERQA